MCKMRWAKTTKQLKGKNEINDEEGAHLNNFNTISENMKLDYEQCRINASLNAEKSLVEVANMVTLFLQQILSTMDSVCQCENLESGNIRYFEK